MIITIEDLKQRYSQYNDVRGKIRREVKNGKYFSIIRGLYETNENTSGILLSSYIYGPSYISFEYALYYYGMIPERVVVFTSATYNKRKTKSYNTSFGRYIYKDVPKSVYPYDINVIEKDGYVYHIATREKALCDMLYDKKTIYSLKQLKELLFEDMRIDVDIFNSLDKNKLSLLAPKYQSKNLNVLAKLVKGEQNASYKQNVK